MKTFDSLIFNNEIIPFRGVKISSKLKLDNGIIVSVIGGAGCYGNGIDTFEIAAWFENKREFIKLSDFDDVLGHLTKDEITEKMIELSKL